MRHQNHVQYAIYLAFLMAEAALQASITRDIVLSSSKATLWPVGAKAESRISTGLALDIHIRVTTSALVGQVCSFKRAPLNFQGSHAIGLRWKFLPLFP